MLRSAVIFVTLLLATPAGAGETVREFRGSDNSTTAVFTVDSPWLLDWRVDGDYVALVALDLKLIDGNTGLYIGSVLRTKHIGNGVKLFNRSGRYRLRVSATLADWTLKIVQLTREEAELYTPKEKS